MFFQYHAAKASSRLGGRVGMKIDLGSCGDLSSVLASEKALIHRLLLRQPYMPFVRAVYHELFYETALCQRVGAL